MDSAQFSSLLGWTAYVSAVTTIATAVTAVLFFTLGEHFGKINDAASVLQMLFMLPVSVGLFLLICRSGAGLILPATIVGILGMFVAAVLQALLVFGMVKYEQTIKAVLAAGGAIGLWLVSANVLALGAGTLPGGLAVCGIAAGAGYLLVALGFRLGGQNHPLSYTGAALVVVGYSIWSIWLGWLLTSGRLVL